MVLWEITLGTAYFLGLKRTYKLALKLQRRLLTPNHPKIQQFLHRKSQETFSTQRNSVMARAVLIHLLRSQTKQLKATNFRTGFHSGRVGHPSPVTRYFNSAPCLASQKRWASRSAAAAEDDSRISIGPRKGGEAGEDNKDSGIVYYGPISSIIKKVKLLSLSTCCLSVSLGPVITFMTAQDMNVIVKGAVASSVIFMSATTTGALHWFVSPYIHKLRWQPGSDSFEVDMMTWLATFVTKTIKFSDIRLAETNRPYVTFQANGEFYFVDADHCHNKALLARLTPQKPAESALKNL